MDLKLRSADQAIKPVQDSIRILLVEDSRGDVVLIERALDKSMPGAFHMDHASLLAQAIGRLEREHYDVVLLDRSLPDVDGFAGLHAIQNMAPMVPIVFLTGYQDEQRAFEAIKQGAQDYLFKDRLDGNEIKRAIQFAKLRKEFEASLISRANFDTLTGLVNRVLFESRLEQALAHLHRQEMTVSLLFIDLDGFKAVNDTFGHLTGDQLLTVIAQHLLEALRASDTVARLGGDEFAILLDDRGCNLDVIAVAEKLLGIFNEPTEVGEQEFNIGLSIGVASCSHRDPCSGKALLHKADAAMYRSKTNGGHQYTVYDPSLEKDFA